MIRFLYHWKRMVCVFKLLIAKIIVMISGKKIISRDIWLFEEKQTEARDNAYHLYRYVKKHHPEINSFYIIRKGSADEPKIGEYGTTIYAETVKHYIYWLAAKYSISSQPHGAAPNPRDWVRRFKGFCRKDQKVVFLQHGIIINDLPGLDYSVTGFDLFSCSAVPEWKYITEGLHYPEKKARLLGLCRFDNLSDYHTQKIILIMPTFRKWLVAADAYSDATEEESERFMQSDYFLRYRNLLTNKTLLQEAEENGYRIIFYLHYAVQSYTGTFSACGSQTVTIADRDHYDVQQLLKDCAVLVTDYSSIFCDFAYMGKPELFYQFDEKQYRGGHYDSGYFNYDTDGFGPVFGQEEDLVHYLTLLLENKCETEPVYMERIRAFFPFRDDHNCERTYNAIIEIQ